MLKKEKKTKQPPFLLLPSQQPTRSSLYTMQPYRRQADEERLGPEGLSAADPLTPLGQAS